MDQLMASLLDLLHELEGSEIPITVGGGFGLYLKRRNLMEHPEPTLFSALPEPRSTNDLDLFIQTEVLVSRERTREVADAIKRLGYTPVEEAKFLQWERSISVAGVLQKVKIDVLVGPLGDAKDNLHIAKPPRARPKGSGMEFHAHRVDEAICLEEAPWEISISGERSNGESSTGKVFIPDAFPYLMMKLHAFDDRRKKAEQAADHKVKSKEQDKERQHAIDLYTIVGMMVEREYERTKELGKDQAENEHVKRACAIIRDHFRDLTAHGLLRLREHPLCRETFQLEELIEVLKEVFAAS